MMSFFKNLERKIRNIRKNFFYEKNIKSELENLQKYIDNLKYEICDEIVNRKARNIRLPKIMSIEDTINKIISEKLSVCRYGDGEFYTVLGKLNSNVYYKQDTDNDLQDRLKIILTQKNPKILTCIWDFWGSWEHFDDKTRKYCLAHILNIRDEIYEYIDFDYIYGNAFISRPYMNLRDKSKAAGYFELLKQIWKGKEIVIVEGEGSRSGVGNDLFSNAKSVERIICPAENAYSKYDDILKKCLEIKKDKLILIALGMTATVLAYDLSNNGYQAIDIGHIDIEYEYFLRNLTEMVNIEGKYINDIGKQSFENIENSEYTNSIIAKVI